MKKLKLCLPALAMALMFSGAYAKPADSVQSTKKDVSYLSVLQASQGDLAKTDQKDIYQLVFKRHDMQALIFSDRPNRIVKFLQPKAMKNMEWNHGPNSFKKDPPNAVLYAPGTPAHVVELLSMSVNKHKVSFTLKSLEANQLTVSKLKQPILVIDSWDSWLKVIGCGLDGGACEDRKIADCFAHRDDPAACERSLSH